MSHHFENVAYAYISSHSDLAEQGQAAGELIVGLHRRRTPESESITTEALTDVLAAAARWYRAPAGRTGDFLEPVPPRFLAGGSRGRQAFHRTPVCPRIAHPEAVLFARADFRGLPCQVCGNGLTGRVA